MSTRVGSKVVPRATRDKIKRLFAEDPENNNRTVLKERFGISYSGICTILLEKEETDGTSS